MKRLVGCALAGAMLGAFGLWACVGEDPQVPAEHGDAGSSSGTTTSGGGGTGTSSGGTSSGGDTSCPAGCLSLPPSGWTGPTAVFQGERSAAPACDAASWFQTQAKSVLPAACDCGQPSLDGAGCNVLVHRSNQGAACATDFATAIATIPGGCWNTAGDYAVKLDPPTVTQGSCSFPNKKVTKPESGDAVLSCTTNVAVCPSKAGCLNRPELDGGYQKLCIFRSGDDQKCPTDYPDRTVAFEHVTDTRMCDCAGVASGTSCTPPATLNAYNYQGTSNNCDGPPTAVTYGACTTGFIMQGFTGINLAGITFQKGSCSTTSQQDGGVKFEAPVTFCCRP